MPDTDASTDSESSADSWTLRDVFGRPHDATLVWFFLPSALSFAILGLTPLRSWDYWWHLTIGRLINYWGAVPDANHYLYTVPEDAPSYVQPWLSDLLVYGLHVATSLHDVLVVRNLVVAGAVGWCGYRAMRRAGSVAVGSLLALAALPVALSAATAGPALFAWLLFPAIVELCYRVDAGDLRAAWLAGIPALAALWANLHSGFWIAGLVAALFGAGAHLREEGSDRNSPDWYIWLACAAGALLAGMLNPRGPALFGFLASDWFATLSTGVARVGATEPIVHAGFAELWALVFWFVAGGIALWRRDSLDPTDALLVGAFGLAAALHADGFIWLALGVPVALAPVAGRAIPALDPSEAPHPVTQRLYTLGALLCIVAAVSTQPTWQWRVDWVANSSLFDARSRAPMAGVAPAETPYEPVELLARRVDPPRLFHDRRYAGYLMYHLTDATPRRKFFVDAREGLPTAEVWSAYHRIVGNESAWRESLEKYDVGAVVLSRRNAELVEWLDASDAWSILMQTDDFTLVVPVEK